MTTKIYQKRNFDFLQKEKIDNEESSGQTKYSTNSILGKKIKRIEENFSNNEYCSICNKEGYLVFCDNCPRSFHFECLQIKESDLPDGDWYCPVCASNNKKIIDEGDKNEKERKRLIKNEKRRLWRRKKKEELEQLKKMEKSLCLDEFVYGTSNGVLNKVTKCSNSYQDTINRMMKLPFNNSKICFNITYSKISGDNEKQNKSLSLPLLFPIPNNLLMNFDLKNKELQDALNKRKFAKIISEELNEAFDENRIEPEDIINTKNNNTDLNQDFINTRQKLELKINNNNININTKEELNKFLHLPNSIQYLNNIIKTNKDYYKYNSLVRDYWNIILEKKNSSGNKHIIKYPINDKELYSFPDLHGLEEKYYTKPIGLIYPYFNGKLFSRLINIYDFISTFAPKIYLSEFSLEELYSLLLISENYKKSEICLLSEIHISLIYLLFLELSGIPLQEINNNSEIEILLIKIIIEFKKTDLKTLHNFIYQTWPELIRLIILSNTFNKSYYTDYKDENDEIILEKIEKITDIISYNTILNFEEKILVLEKLVMICCSTNYVRSQIKESQEKKIEMKKQEKELEDNLKEIENIKKDLEREYQIIQPNQKISKINQQIEQLYYEKFSKTQMNKMKIKLEQEKIKFQNLISELENITSRKDDISSQITKIKGELNEIPIISKKCLGGDGRGFKYFYFPWMENKIFIRINLNNNENQKYNKYEWRIIDNENEIKDLINKLSEKGVQENELKKKLILITKYHLKILKNIDNTNLSINEIFHRKVLKYENLKSPLYNEKNDKNNFLTSNTNQYEIIIEKIKKMESLITNHLKQDSKQYESIENRTKIQNWIPTINKIQNFVSLLLFFNERIKNPYKKEENKSENNSNITTSKPKKILNDDESSNEILNNNNNNSPLNKNDDFNYEFINKKLQWANRIKLWSKAFEGYNLEKIYLEYLRYTNSFPRLIICINMFEIILSELSRRKEFYRKKNDENIDDNKNNINSNDENSDVIENSTSRKTLINKKKLIDWNVKCMYCHEFGDLLCCEDCPNVAHLSCAKLSKEPDVWRCVYCSIKKNI